MKKIELSDRQLKILSAIVRDYIQNGEPVSSGTVYAVLKLDVCASTIRSDMSELTAKGFLKKIHTSSGSIPSASGYRVYANRIADEFKNSNNRRCCKNFGCSLLTNCAETGSKESLYKNILNLVSEATNCVTLLSLKNTDSLAVTDIRVVKIEDSSVCTFVLFSNGEIKSKILKGAKELESDVLLNLERVLNGELLGLKVKDISVGLIQKIAAKSSTFSFYVVEILNEIYALIKNVLNTQCYFSRIPRDIFKDSVNTMSAFSIYNFLENKKLLENFMLENGTNLDCITVRAGKDNACLGLEDFSIVSSEHIGGKKASGRISAIGPMRMNYSLVISSLVYVSSFFRKLFNHSLEEQPV